MRAQDATLRIVANDGDIAPGTNGDTFDGFLVPEISSSGDIAFVGSLARNAGFCGRCGIWVDVAMGSLILVAISGEIAPGTGGQTFDLFDRVVINDQGLTAFQGRSSVTPSWLWREGADGLELLFSQGDIIDESTGETFVQFTPIKFGNAGELIFRANIRQVSGVRDNGLFSLSADGTLFLMVREGDFLQVGINDFRQITSIGGLKAGSQNFIGDFDIPILVNFSDSSSGLFIISNITPEVPIP